MGCSFEQILLHRTSSDLKVSKVKCHLSLCEEAPRGKVTGNKRLVYVAVSEDLDKPGFMARSKGLATLHTEELDQASLFPKSPEKDDYFAQPVLMTVHPPLAA